MPIHSFNDQPNCNDGRCWVFFLSKSIAHRSSHAAHFEEGGHDDDDDCSEHGPDASTHGAQTDQSESGFKGAVTINLKNGRHLPVMDTFTGKADPYVVTTCDGMTHKSAVRASTLDPSWNETMQFNCYANRSTARLEVFDSEAMGAHRSMGYVHFIIPPSPIPQTMLLKLTGQLADGRLATGTLNLQVSFTRGGRVTKSVETLSEFQTFCQEESFWDWLMFWLQPSRRIEKGIFF